MDGFQAASRTRLALQKLGLSAENHVARTVTREMLQSFDLILTMERGHQEALQVEFPQESKRIFLLSEMVGARFDIWDPMGGTQENFDATAQELSMLLSKASAKIEQIATQNAAVRLDLTDTVG